MTTVAAVIHYNITNFTRGTNVYTGIVSCQITRSIAKGVPILQEGETVPSIIISGAIDGSPVSFSITSQSSATLSAIAADTGDITYNTEHANGSGLRVVTITSPVIERSGLQNNRNMEGGFNLSGVALTCTEAAAAS